MWVWSPHRWVRGAARAVRRSAAGRSALHVRGPGQVHVGEALDVYQPALRAPAALRAVRRSAGGRRRCCRYGYTTSGNRRRKDAGGCGPGWRCGEEGHRTWVRTRRGLLVLLRDQRSRLRAGKTPGYHVTGALSPSRVHAGPCRLTTGRVHTRAFIHTPTYPCPSLAPMQIRSYGLLCLAVAATLFPRQAGGNVLRLVGLYHKTRGAHTFFMKAGEVARPGGYVVNLLHYEDAAGLAAAVGSGTCAHPLCILLPTCLLRCKDAAGLAALAVRAHAWARTQVMCLTLLYAVLTVCGGASGCGGCIWYLQVLPGLSLRPKDTRALGLIPPQILRGDGSGPFRGRAFMGTDGHPVSFEDMMEVGAGGGEWGKWRQRGVGVQGWGRPLHRWWGWAEQGAGEGGVTAAHRLGAW